MNGGVEQIQLTRGSFGGLGVHAVMLCCFDLDGGCCCRVPLFCSRLSPFLHLPLSLFFLLFGTCTAKHGMVMAHLPTHITAISEQASHLVELPKRSMAEVWSWASYPNAKVPLPEPSSFPTFENLR